MAGAESTTFDLETDSLTSLQMAVVGLAAVAGVIHLYLSLSEAGLALLLGGLGFLAGAGLVLLDVRRRLLYVLGVPYALLFLVGWIADGMPYGWIGLVAAAAEVLLVVALAYVLTGGRGTATDGEIPGLE